jgi:hypothetical protein
VDAVDLGQVVGQTVNERVTGEAAQMAFAGELAQHVCEVGLDVLGQGEQVAFGDRDGTDLPGPLVHVTEDLAVKRLQVREVVVAGDRTLGQLDDADRRRSGLAPGQFAGVRLAEAVTQDAGPRVDVGILGHGRDRAPPSGGPGRLVGGGASDRKAGGDHLVDGQLTAGPGVHRGLNSGRVKALQPRGGSDVGRGATPLGDGQATVRGAGHTVHFRRRGGRRDSGGCRRVDCS